MNVVDSELYYYLLEFNGNCKDKGILRELLYRFLQYNQKRLTYTDAGPTNGAPVRRAIVQIYNKFPDMFTTDQTLNCLYNQLISDLDYDFDVKHKMM